MTPFLTPEKRTAALGVHLDSNGILISADRIIVDTFSGMEDLIAKASKADGTLVFIQLHGEYDRITRLPTGNVVTRTHNGREVIPISEFNAKLAENLVVTYIPNYCGVDGKGLQYFHDLYNAVGNYLSDKGAFKEGYIFKPLDTSKLNRNAARAQ